MTDEMDELRRANPVTPEALGPAVALDRATLFEALEADSGDQRPRRLRRRPDRRSSSTTRVGYVGALAAAAAALVGFVLVGDQDSPTDQETVESVEETPTPPALVVEIDDDQRVDQIPDSETTPDTSLPDRSAAAPDQTSTSVPQPAPSTSPTTAAGTVETTVPNRAETIEGPFDATVDLLVLHYDFAHLDDGHAALAAREMANWFGLYPHVVAGTFANGDDRNLPHLEPMMQAAWGDSWIDAASDRSSALNRSVEQWIAAIEVGGRVWVADGGASDFTADVLHEIQRQHPELDTRAAIRVVQHNNRNESTSAPANLAFLKAETTYVRIDDGNGSNETANLNQPSEAFVARALAGPNSANWSIAFQYLPAEQLDFSDTVEVLHILGVGIDEVADPDDFADRFMS